MNLSADQIATWIVRQVTATRRRATLARAQGEGGGDRLPGRVLPRRQRLPQAVAFARQRILAGEQGDAGGALGQYRIGGGSCRLQVAARGLRQLSRLQGELAGDAGFERILARCGHCGRGRESADGRSQQGRAHQQAEHRSSWLGHGGGPVQCAVVPAA